MTASRGSRPATVTMLATATVVMVAGCGGSGPVVEDAAPVVIAEPVPFEDSSLEQPLPSSPPPEPSPDGADGTDGVNGVDDTGAGAVDEASPSPTGEVRPSSADAAAFIASEAGAGLEDLDHAVVDLDGDSVPEVVVTGTRDRVGVVRVAWWTSSRYEVLASDEAGPGRDVTDLRATDVNRDDRVELLVTVEGDRRQSLAMWSVAGRGKIERLEAAGGCSDGHHVFGVTTARLQHDAEGPPAIVADCDESPLPVADWSEHRWVWQDGAYRHVEQDPGPSGDPGRGGGGPPRDAEDTDEADDGDDVDDGDDGDSRAEGS